MNAMLSLPRLVLTCFGLRCASIAPNKQLTVKVSASAGTHYLTTTAQARSPGSRMLSQPGLLGMG